MTSTAWWRPAGRRWRTRSRATSTVRRGRRGLLHLRRRRAGGRHRRRTGRRAGRARRGGTTRSPSSSPPRRARRRSAPTCSSRAACSTPTRPSPTYWPEFAANGKAHVLVRHVLSHSRRAAGRRRRLHARAALAWAPVVEQLARQAPRWEPGTAVGYHMRTYGWLTGEIVRRVTGTTARRVLPRRDRRSARASTGGSGCRSREEPRVAPRHPARGRDRSRGPRAHGRGHGARHDARRRAHRAGRTTSTTTRCGTRARCTSASCRRRTGSRPRAAVARMYAALGDARSTASRILDDAAIARATTTRDRGHRPRDRRADAVRARLLARRRARRARRARARSATRARAARSASPTPSTASASAT